MYSLPTAGGLFTLMYNAARRAFYCSSPVPGACDEDVTPRAIEKSIVLCWLDDRLHHSRGLTTVATCRVRT
jgi:hypothetical protein